MPVSILLLAVVFVLGLGSLGWCVVVRFAVRVVLCLQKRRGADPERSRRKSVARRSQSGVSSRRGEAEQERPRDIPLRELEDAAAGWRSPAPSIPLQPLFPYLLYNLCWPLNCVQAAPRWTETLGALCTYCLCTFSFLMNFIELLNYFYF